MTDLETYFDLPHHLDVSFDALGKEYTAQVDGMDISVRFPRRHDSGQSAFLQAPVLPNVFNDDGLAANILGEFLWGRESPYNSSNVASNSAWVYGLGLATQCDDGGEDAAVEQLTEAMNSWWTRVCDWIEVLTGQVHSPVGKVQLLGPHQPVWAASSGTVTRRYGLHEAGGMRRSSGRPGAPMPLTDALFNSALKQVSREPPTPWLLIRDARVAHHRGSRRLALIDAGTAAELAIVELLRGRHPQLSAVQFDAVLGKHQMLGKRLDLLTKTGGNPPADTYTKLVEPRNRAAHEGVVPSEKECSDALLVATHIVESAYPLTTYR